MEGECNIHLHLLAIGDFEAWDNKGVDHGDRNVGVHLFAMEFLSHTVEPIALDLKYET